MITELGFDTNSITVIPNIEEKLISFTKYVSNKFQICFVDTYRFMALSLEKLTNDLALGKFRETIKEYSIENIDLVTRKEVYRDEYTDSWERLDNSQLPTKDKFYNTLSETIISDAGYEHALRVWNFFKFKSLGE